MRFEYLAPQTTEEAISMLSAYQGKAMAIAGGTDLLNKIRAKLLSPEYVVDICRIAGLDYIQYDSKGGLTLGALVTIGDIQMSVQVQKHHPLLAYAASVIGAPAIRNVATLGGNICHAAPCAETVPSLIALEAKAKLVGPNGTRIVPVEKIITGPGRTSLQTGEILVEVEVPPMRSDSKGVYVKYTTRGMVNPAIVGVAAIATMDGKRCTDIRVTLGSVAATPFRAIKAEEILRGKEVDDTLIEWAARTASDESAPMTDVRVTADYKKEMIKVFTRDALRKAINH